MNTRYVLASNEPIGRGGFCDVYRAFDCWSGSTVAKKVLRDPTADGVRRLAREKDILTIHLSNPFVVDILDSDLECSQPYLVLEYSEKGSLQRYVQNRRGWQRIAGWLYDVSRGLAALHERGDFVRDIKPSNLLQFKYSDGTERIKIADFGLGQREDASSRMTRSVMGTEGYIDPVAKVTGIFSAASDIYSLGITGRELLTGSRELDVPLPGPVELRALLQAMTDLKLGHRPTARRLSEDLEAILYGAEATQEATGNGLGWLLAGVGAAALLAANSNTWDRRAQRYRDGQGRFRPGSFF